MIKTVIRCSGEIVMVFNKKGEQIPGYQGEYQKVKGGILKDAPLDAVFGHLFNSQPGLRKVPREEW